LNYLSFALPVVTSVGIAGENQAFNIYPNPVKAGSELLIAVEGVASANIHVSLYNFLGQTVYETTLNPSDLIRCQVPAGLPSGLYHLVMTDDKGAMLNGKKILIEANK
jgi:hypothetical protein